MKTVCSLACGMRNFMLFFAFPFCAITRSNAEEFINFDEHYSQVAYISELSKQFKADREQSYLLLREGNWQQAKFLLLKAYEANKLHTDWHLAYFSDLFYFSIFSKEQGKIQAAQRQASVLLTSISQYVEVSLNRIEETARFMELQADIHAKIFEDYPTAGQFLVEAARINPTDLALLNKKVRLERKLRQLRDI